MFHSRRMEHRINKIHERALHLIYPSDSKVTFTIAVFAVNMSYGFLRPIEIKLIIIIMTTTTATEGH